jgi:hypothetical protein
VFSVDTARTPFNGMELAYTCPHLRERAHIVEALQRVRIASKKELFSVGFTLKSSENIKARIGKWVLGIGGGGDSDFLHPTVKAFSSLRRSSYGVDISSGKLRSCSYL